MTPRMLTSDDFDFDLPPELIAQHPAGQRGESRLLQINGETLGDHVFGELPDLVETGDLLVLNDTRVIHARLFGKKESGGRVEVLVERVVDARRAVALVRSSKSPRQGSRIVLEDAIAVTVGGRCGAQGEFFEIELTGEGNLCSLIEEHGRLPLPPYINHPATRLDEARYQTVYARHPGAVAAPTAGLHFDEALLARLSAAGVNIAWLTLHVGAGTFQPVRARAIADHRMHSERFVLPSATVAAVKRTQARGGRVIAVGTTTLRALEAAAAAGELQPGASETDLFITPGFPFRIVNRLITNFHLPRSTLLMLVSAFAGVDEIRHAYRHAIAQRYRFFSYGDAMLLDRR